MHSAWVCRACRRTSGEVTWQSVRHFSHQVTLKQAVSSPARDVALRRTRNIGIIAHIDAGKTTTTERMLYYSGFTRRLGNVDEGDTITDFLPAERARGITIQSAAITFHWPPSSDSNVITSLLSDKASHTVNLIDTPGHADFTFEVIRSLRILDGAICILDGVAGVEAQTEKVWTQASNYRIPRIIYVNKLDRDGAAFNRTVHEIASRLHTWPVLCHVPWWKDGVFMGVGDAVNFRALSWESGGDGRTFQVFDIQQLDQKDPNFATELRAARTALIEALTEYDETIVEEFLESDEDWEGFPADKINACMRRLLVSDEAQQITPVYAGASFRNIGVQPLLDAINVLFPSPLETHDPKISLDNQQSTLGALVTGKNQTIQSASKKGPQLALVSKNLEACALAFKVVNDPKRGVLVYVRVYSGAIARNALLYNTNLSLAERAPRLLRMYASEAQEVQSIDEGQIGVIAGLKHARTGDTLLVYHGTSAKHAPPSPINTLQLQPIVVPPPLFYTAVEPNSLSEEKHLNETIALLLREDPSLQVTVDAESGQTHLAGMGELHLEIARDRLIQDFKVKARMGKIEIGYREAIQAVSPDVTQTFSRDVAGKQSEASCTTSVAPLEEGALATLTAPEASEDEQVSHIPLPDNNLLTITHTGLSSATGRPISTTPAAITPDNPDTTTTPLPFPFSTLLTALTHGCSAALARGPTHLFPLHSTHITIPFSAATHLTPSSTPAALTTATRQAVRAALDASAAQHTPAMMEPVMLATVAVDEASLGAVVHDLSSARGGAVVSLDADSAADVASQQAVQARRLSPQQLGRVYAPRDPFQSGDGGGGAQEQRVSVQRQIRARVPLKEMVGYLKHLRSLTGGRGTFVMSVDRFERMSAQRMKAALAELRGDVV
ncbi:hypothetical protein FH972_023723 [Carpinus fangiana]|uniref:Ribosome-releasing factor 2, mitochondrial n=1 Tax=Carpinus fangiana TaxID=176857 RepID=A0A5N6KWI6_9ROSI|nr:hypothetical protein FH972_023723 [Carpinus fangiana]